MGQDKINEGGKKVINNPEIDKITVENKGTKPEQYQEKVDDGIRSEPQPFKKKDSN